MKLNMIRRLVTDDGSVVEETGQVHKQITYFHKLLFLSHVGHRYEELLQQVPTCVNADMNEVLMKEYSDEEIKKKALDDMGDLKAPGLDGMAALFYKTFWDITGKDVIREVRALLNGGKMPKGWNEIVVVLISKVPSPERLKDLRPISLCNVVYKIASKGLSNRLKLILPEFFSWIRVPLCLGV